MVSCRNDKYYRKTETYLYAYPDIKDKTERDKLDLRDLKREKSAVRSKDILYRSVKGGVRISPEELQEIRIKALDETIKRNEKELDRIDYALSAVTSDGYYEIIPNKYFQQKTDEEVAEILECDPSTIRRNKKRLVQRIAVRLYGAEALQN